MQIVPWFVDMTAARRVARNLESKYPDLSDGEKRGVIADVRTRDPKLAQGLERVWELATATPA